MKSLVLVCLLLAAASASPAQLQNKRCQDTPSASKSIQKAINECQDEIKLAILQEALQSIQAAVKSSRTKREIFNEEEKKIAGCLLQCVYRKVRAVDSYGYPERNGLVRLYTEGVQDSQYYEATAQAVNSCMGKVQQNLIGRSNEPGLACHVSYDVFECVSEKVAQYCETP